MTLFAPLFIESERNLLFGAPIERTTAWFSSASGAESVSETSASPCGKEVHFAYAEMFQARRPLPNEPGEKAARLSRRNCRGLLPLPELSNHSFAPVESREQGHGNPSEHARSQLR